MSRTCSTVHRALGAEIEIDLLQLVLDLPRVAAGQENEEIERFLIELQPSLSRGLSHERSVAASSQPDRDGIELVDDLQLGVFGERFVKRAALIHFRRADQKCHFAAPRSASSSSRASSSSASCTAGGAPDEDCQPGNSRF